ncbi:MAG TPA: VOC family protein [Gemmatimonadales bacterium]|nr:VOC family protein [Gemmatimonadales bacterium]
MKKMTPILYVEAIEPCLGFWVDRLGFAKTVEVPHGDRLGFVILVKGQWELMYQTWDSADADLKGAVPRTTGRSAALYIEVEDIDAVERAMVGAAIVHARRKAFYGATEIFVREPGGHVVGFGQMEAA